MAAGLDVFGILLAAATLALLGWYFVHVARAMREAARAVAALPGALERAFDGTVPFWLRIARIAVIMLLCLTVAIVVVRKFGITF